MTTIYYASIQAHRNSNGLELLSPARRARYNALKSIDDKARNKVAGLLLHRVFGEKAWEIQEDSHGKPYLEGHHFNLSHSGDFVVLAVSSSPVGVDLQAPRPHRPGRYFSPEEQRWLQAGGDFFHLWTGKEALGKALGVGLTKAILATNVLSGQAGDFHLIWQNLEGHTLCVAAQDSLVTLLPMTESAM